VKPDGTIDFKKLGQNVIDQFKDTSGSVDFKALTKVALDIAQKDGLVKTTVTNKKVATVNKKSVAISGVKARLVDTRQRGYAPASYKQLTLTQSKDVAVRIDPYQLAQQKEEAK